jgi:hypothetical protein
MIEGGIRQVKCRIDALPSVNGVRGRSMRQCSFAVRGAAAILPPLSPRLDASHAQEAGCR